MIVLVSRSATSGKRVWNSEYGISYLLCITSAITGQWKPKAVAGRVNGVVMPIKSEDVFVVLFS